MAPLRVDRYMTEARQFGTSLSGPLANLASGDVKTELGFQRQRQSIRFDRQTGTVSRDVTSTFAHVRLPLLTKKLELSLGARHDSYSDVRGVTRPTYTLTWRPSGELSIAGSASMLYRPPSLYELLRPRIATPGQIFDPARNELAPVTIIFGGNQALKSTGGKSLGLTFTWQTDSWNASANLWQLELEDRLAIPSAPVLLTTEGQLARERVTRAPQSQQEQESGRPGRLTSVDVSYANFGEAMARGLDLSMERQLDTSIGSIGVRLDITHFFSFDYSELPSQNAPLEDKVGRTSLEGTIPRERAVLGLSYLRGPWRGELFVRFHSSVEDYVVAADAPTGRSISAQALFDVNVSRALSDIHEVTLGVENLLDDKPPFAEGFGDYGYDQSQGDLTGRVAYLKWNSSF
jgi:iron complex outermembrane receptor protein